MSLTNTQYDAVMRIYQQRQLDNQKNLQARRARAYAAIPRLEELEQQLGSRAAALARARVSGQEKDLENASALFGRIREEQAALLSAGGFPENYLQEQYSCSLCRDTGFLRDPGSGRNLGPCSCFRRTAVSILYRESGMQEEIGQDSFEAFRLDYYPEDMVHPKTGKNARQNMQDILHACRRFCSQFDQFSGHLLFYGDSGLGKTFLSHCIARELMDQSYSVLYFTSQSLFDQLAQITFRGGESGNSSFSDDLLQCDLLIVDDLGTEMTNTFVASRLFTLLNERIRARKSLLISTNLPLSSIASTYSERIFSRITEHFMLLNFFGRDIRIQKRLSGRS